MRFLKISSLILLLTSSSWDATFAYCDSVQKPIASAEDAKKCAQERFYDAKKDNLYNFASAHLGNTDKCEDDSRSYFSENEDLFYDAVEGIKVTSCQEDSRNSKRYRCIGTTPGPACHENKPSKKITAGIWKDNGDFSSFYPK